VPLVPVSSLALVVASRRPVVPGRYLAAIDALRGEHYVELFETGVNGVIEPQGPTLRIPSSTLAAFAADHGATLVGPPQVDGLAVEPHASAAAAITNLIDATTPADLAGWEPAYGRLAEAQVKWETAHGRPLAPQ
jgi:tRNA threonylcarbamoyladenosine biosynthesis protein TsaB